jgi:hypothetical protein
MAMGDKNRHGVKFQAGTTLQDCLMERGIPYSRVHNQRLVTTRRRENPAIGRKGLGYNDLIGDSIAQTISPVPRRDKVLRAIQPTKV